MSRTASAQDRDPASAGIPVARTGICTDTSALLPSDVAERYGITVVPVSVLLDDEELDESADVDYFYARLETGAKAKTAQPSPAAFADAYARAELGGASHVLSIHLDSRISGTTRSAMLAAREAEIPVTVIDTRTVSFGVAACVRVTALALAEDASPTAATRVATNLGRDMQNAFVAVGGPRGRLPRRDEWTVLTYANGAPTVLEQCRTEDAAIAFMTRHIDSGAVTVETAVGHAGAVVEKQADQLAAALSRLPRAVSVERYRVGPSVGAHTGPVSFGAFWWPSDP